MRDGHAESDTLTILLYTFGERFSLCSIWERSWAGMEGSQALKHEWIDSSSSALMQDSKIKKKLSHIKNHRLCSW